MHVWELRIMQVHLAGKVQTCYPLDITNTVTCHQQQPVLGMENLLCKYHNLHISVMTFGVI